MEDIYRLFRQVFPYIRREEQTLRDIMSDERYERIERRNDSGELIAVSMISAPTILLLMVREDYRGLGIGSQLLRQSEGIIKQQGHGKVVLGLGKDYLMPGVPTSKRYFEAEHENLYPFLNSEASTFFEKRHYHHAWKDANCFDMRMSLADFHDEGCQVGDTIDDILYRWADRSDLESIVACVDDAEKEFTGYYLTEDLYNGQRPQQVLVADNGSEIVGTLIVSVETEGKDLGSVGCTTVRHDHRGRHIGVNMVKTGTRYLKDIGLSEACLNYTYSGLDHMYGYAGYQICTYYMMGEKDISQNVYSSCL